jgi:hypothetical protein
MSAVYHDYVDIARFAGATNAGLSAATAGDVWFITVPYKCQVRRWALVWLTTDATDAVLELDKLPTAGDASTGRVNLLSITKDAVNRQGKYIYKDPTTSVVLNEGDQVVIEVTANVSAASTFAPILLVERMPEQPANQADMLASA